MIKSLILCELVVKKNTLPFESGRIEHEPTSASNPNFPHTSRQVGISAPKAHSHVEATMAPR